MDAVISQIQDLFEGQIVCRSFYFNHHHVLTNLSLGFRWPTNRRGDFYSLVNNHLCIFHAHLGRLAGWTDPFLGYRPRDWIRSTRHLRDSVGGIDRYGANHACGGSALAFL
jgi:hypothetical protein